MYMYIYIYIYISLRPILLILCMLDIYEFLNLTFSLKDECIGQFKEQIKEQMSPCVSVSLNLPMNIIM